MKERPILFNTEMVQAILDGRKTTTRRLVPQWQLPKETNDGDFISIAQRRAIYGFAVFGNSLNECMENYNDNYNNLCPFGSKGDQFWVKETHKISAWDDSSNICFDYKASPEEKKKLHGAKLPMILTAKNLTIYVSKY